ncbi:MAG: hypothetical protein ABRQ24_03425 [Syntrophomonadaceae bacterium]
MAYGGNLKDIMKIAEARGGTAHRELQILLAVLKDFISEDEIAVVYPRISLVDPEYAPENGAALELVVFAVDGRILVASVLPGDRFELVITNKTEICNLQVSGYLAETSQEVMPTLSINFKDGSKLDLNSEEDANDYWGEEYPDIIRMIIAQLR